MEVILLPPINPEKKHLNFTCIVLCFHLSPCAIICYHTQLDALTEGKGWLQRWPSVGPQAMYIVAAGHHKKSSKAKYKTIKAIATMRMGSKPWSIMTMTILLIHFPLFSLFLVIRTRKDHVLLRPLRPHLFRGDLDRCSKVFGFRREEHWKEASEPKSDWSLGDPPTFFPSKTGTFRSFEWVLVEGPPSTTTPPRFCLRDIHIQLCWGDLCFRPGCTMKYKGYTRDVWKTNGVATGCKPGGRKFQKGNYI